MWTPLSSPPVWDVFQMFIFGIDILHHFLLYLSSGESGLKTVCVSQVWRHAVLVFYLRQAFFHGGDAKTVVRWHETKIHARTDVLNSHVHSHNAHISIQWMFKVQQTIITPVVGYNSRPHLYSAQFTPSREHSLQSCLSWNYRQIHLNISFTSYRVPTYTPGSRPAMWINCLAERQKCRAIAGFELGLSALESSEYTNIPCHLHIHIHKHYAWKPTTMDVCF